MSVTIAPRYTDVLRRIPKCDIRLTERPIMTREQLIAIAERLIRATTTENISITIRHTERVVTRLTRGQVFSSDDGSSVIVSAEVMGKNPPIFTFQTNQPDASTIEAGIRQCEALLRALPGYAYDSGMRHYASVQDSATPVHLWHDSTVVAMTESRETLVPEILRTVQQAGFEAAGFLGFRAHAAVSVQKDGNIVFAHEETDAEVNITAYDRAGTHVGWGGAVARDWTKLDYQQALQQAITMAQLGRNPVAVEPGRRTAILTPTALVPMLRYLTGQFDARATSRGETALSKSTRGGNKLHEQVFDTRLTLESNPDDVDGGYRPYHDNWATPQMKWVERGVLVNLAYDVMYAMQRGKAYAEEPQSLRIYGGDTSLEEMVAQCQEGILVNRVADVDMLDKSTCLLTGVTHGGCFLVKDGKIAKPIKNFRFLESPFSFLNNLVALGRSERAAFGYTPESATESLWEEWDGWCRAPMIVPPMMVRDFNFSSLVDAV